MSWCATCGKALVPMHGTATARCCTGRWYWHDEPPLPRDNLVPIRTTEVKGRKFWLYEWRR